MTTLVYVIPGMNFRELSKSDMKKYLGEDSEVAGKLRFEKDVPQEVDDSVAEVLLTHEHFAGEFAEVDVEEDSPEADKQAAADKAAKKAAKKASASTPGPNASSETTGNTGKGTSTGGTGSTAGTGSTGKGTSTAGSTT